MVKFVVSSDVDSSDDELDGPVEQSPLSVGWVKVDDKHTVGISSLPGSMCPGRRRSVRCDVDHLRDIGVKDSFVLCPSHELRAVKARSLLWELDEAGINVHHAPINPSENLTMATCNKVLDELEKTVLTGTTTVVHCLHGCGRSSMIVALLIMRFNGQLSAEAAIDIVRSQYGPSAICSIRQYNFMKEFRQRMQEQAAAKSAAEGASSGAAAATAPVAGSLCTPGTQPTDQATAAAAAGVAGQASAGASPILL